MNMKTIALSAISLCAANACASLSYSEATTTTFDSMLSESGFVWIGSTSGAFDTNWHVWQSADGSLNNGINQIADYARIADAVNQKGRLRIESGSYSFPKFNIGDKGTGYLTVNGGKVTTTDQFNVGINGATSVFEMNGGEVVVGSESYWGADANTTATANINANGALTLNAKLNLVNGNGSTCTVNVDGGKIFACADLQLASGGNDTSTATLNISNGGEVTCETEAGGALWVKLSSSGTSKSVININKGGILKAWHFQQISTGESEINFNGGTLVALGSDNRFNAYLIGDTNNNGHDSHLSVTVGENGGTLDVNGKAIKIKNVVIGGTGRLTITGGGSVKFEAVPTCPLYIEEGVVELPVGASSANVTLGSKGYLQFDLSSITSDPGATQTLASSVTITPPEGEDVAEHIIVNNGSTKTLPFFWNVGYANNTLTATYTTSEGNKTTGNFTIYTGYKSEAATEPCDWVNGFPNENTKMIIPYATKLILWQSSVHCGELVLNGDLELAQTNKGDDNRYKNFQPRRVTGDGTLIISFPWTYGYFESKIASGLATEYFSQTDVDVPVIVTGTPKMSGKAEYPLNFNKSVTINSGASVTLNTDNYTYHVNFNGDLKVDGTLTLNSKVPELRGAIAGSGTISGSFTTAEGAVLKSTASADGGVYSATCLTVEGNADLSNATVEIEGGEALADAGSSTEIILLKATGKITWPASVNYAIPGQKHVWTITTGTTTVGETTYNTLKAVRTAYGFMVIIAGETEATVEDREFGEWVDKVDYTPASGYFSEKNGNGLSPIVAYMLGYPTYDDESAATLAATQNPDGFTLNFVAKGEANNVNGYALQMSIEQSSDLETWTVVDGTTSQGTSAKLLLASVGSAPYFRLTADLVAASTSQE